MRPTQMLKWLASGFSAYRGMGGSICRRLVFVEAGSRVANARSPGVAYMGISAPVPTVRGSLVVRYRVVPSDREVRRDQ